MGVTVRLVDSKFFAELNNGSDFSLNLTDFADHLKGGVTEKIKAELTVQVDWMTHLSTFDLIVDSATSYLRITDLTANFETDGITVGSLIKFSIYDGASTRQYQGTIGSVTGGEITVNGASVTQGAAISDGTHSYSNKSAYVTGLSDITALKYKHGLIENNESFNTLSKLTNSDLLYSFSGINHGVPLTYATGTQMGINKAGYTGSAEVAFSRLVLDKDLIYNEPTTQEFIIKHEFAINPLYRDGEDDSLTGVDVPPIDIFNGNMSLKYVAETEWRTLVNDPNTAKNGFIDTLEGSVGYLGESFNGFPNRYTVSNVIYHDFTNNIGLTKLSLNTVNLVTFTINSLDSNIDSAMSIVIGHSAILNSNSYSNSPLNYNELWINETIRTLEGDPDKDSGIFSDFSCTRISATQLDVTVKIEYTTDQINSIENEQQYALLFTIQDPTQDVNNGGKVVDRIDINNYTKSSDIDGLFDPIVFDQYPHPNEFDHGVTQGYSSGKLFIEDGQMSDIEFNILNEFEGNDVVLDSLNFKIVAYDSVNNTWFDLRKLNIDLSDQVQVGNIQNIVLNSDRGYLLKDSDMFNYLNIETTSNDGTWQGYSMQIGYKMPWQDWLSLIGAETLFYDNSEPFNGLNNNASNYCFSNDYKIRFILDANVTTNSITTNYILRSGEFEAYDYGTDDLTPDGFTAEIQTLNSNGVVLNNNIIQSGVTEFRAIFTPSLGNQPVFTVNVDFTDVANTWTRYAHGNKYIVAPFVRIPNWDNNQADDVDTFSDGTTAFNKHDASLYTTTTNTILANQNCLAIYGAYSIDKYEYYYLTGKMYSLDSDNDAIKYDVAINVDDLGVESTLSLIATTGGVTLDISPTYVHGDDTTNVIQTVASGFAGWALVYNFGKSDCKQLAYYPTTESGFGWSSPAVGDFDFGVIRQGKDITINGEWTINGTTFTNTINFDITSDSDTSKFAGFRSIGFAFVSQTNGGFKDIVLIDPSVDYYSILRMEPKESGSDFGITELSTLIEAPANNALTQITGVDKKSTLSWNGTSFITQGLFDTNQINLSNVYKLSAEIRRRAITDSYPLGSEFEFTIDTSQGDGISSFELPISTLFGDIFVDYGDGNSYEITSIVDPRITHAYAIGGIYTVKLWGDYNWRFADLGDKNKLITIVQWGRFKLNGNDFWGCSNLISTPLAESPQVRGNTLLYSFRDTTSLTNLYANDMDVSGVVSMVSTFRNSALTYFNVNSWDFSSVSSMADFGIIGSFTPVFYGELLTTLANQTLISIGLLGMGTTKYPIANQPERDILTNAPNSWVITDGGAI